MLNVDKRTVALGKATANSQLGLPRRLLVEPHGDVHDPNCRYVPATAESHGWGEVRAVDDAVRQLSTGQRVVSHRRGVLPGPDGIKLCRCIQRLL